MSYLCDMMPSCKICIPLVNKMPTDTGEQRCCNKMEKKAKKSNKIKTTLFFVNKKTKKTPIHNHDPYFPHFRKSYSLNTDIFLIPTNVKAYHYMEIIQTTYIGVLKININITFIKNFNKTLSLSSRWNDTIKSSRRF